MDDSNISEKHDRPDAPSQPVPDRDEIAGDVDARRLEESAAGLGGTTADRGSAPDDELSRRDEHDQRHLGNR